MTNALEQSPIDGLVGESLPAGGDLPDDFDPHADGILMSHQKKWLADKSPVKIAEKCRRSGFTFAEALDDTITASTARGEGGSNVFYIGDTKEKGREFISYCATFAKTVAGELLSIDEFLFEDKKEGGDSKFISSFRITFASGYSIVALSSRPENIRGLQGIVVIDEAAFHKDVGEVIDAAVALLIWGGRIRIISTHNGRLNPFNELIERTRAGKTSYSVQRITFDEVIENGLYDRVKMMRPDIMPFDEWCATIRSSYTDKAREAEELDTIPRDAEGSAVSRVQVLACVDKAIPVFRLAKEPDFLLYPEAHRRADIHAWCEANLKPVLTALNPNRRKALGADIARKGHLTSFWLAQIAPNMKRETVLIVELRRMPFDNQRQILFYILDALRGGWNAAIDAGGLGADTAESARVRYGARIEEVSLGSGWYRDHGPKIVSAIEDVTISVPSDEDIVTDICALAYVNGVVKIPDGFENTGSDGGKRHADSAISALLMEFAAVQDSVTIDFQSAGTRVPEAAEYAHGDDEIRDDIDTETGFGTVSSGIDYGGFGGDYNGW